MRVLEEMFSEPPRAGMLPEFVLQRASELAVLQRKAREENASHDKSEIRQGLIDVLGLERIPRVSGLKLIDRIVESDHVVEKIVFEATPGLPVPALIYLPLGPGPHPAVVHPPGHVMEDGKLAEALQRFNLHLVRNGIATLCYDTLGQGERRIGWHQHGQLAPLLVGFTSLGLMVRDSLAALDILEDRQDIDSDRLGMVGASGGGFSSIFSSVIDDRIKVGVVSSMGNTHVSQIRDAAFGTGWDSWVDLCNQVPRLCTIGSMGEILACVAPRILLMANAENDPPFPLEGAREVAAEVNEILKAENTADCFTFREVPGGHGFASPAMRTSVAEFLVTNLGSGKVSVEEHGEPTFPPQWPIPHHEATAQRPQRALAEPSAGTCLPEPTDSNGPVVALAKERARELRSQRQPLTAERLSVALGPFPERTPIKARVTNHLTLNDQNVQRISIEVEPGITIDALFLLPQNWTDDLPPVLVVLDEGGKEQALRSVEVIHARQRGWAVLIPDLRGTGESAASEFEIASAAWMIDRDLLNQRIWDTLQVVEFLSQRYSSGQQIDKGRIIVVGADAFQLVALLATALDPRIAGVATRGFASIEDLLVANTSVTPMMFRFNLLEVLDFPELGAFIAPRPARFGLSEVEATEILDVLTEKAATA